jgi:hypothetical protein
MDRISDSDSEDAGSIPAGATFCWFQNYGIFSYPMRLLFWSVFFLSLFLVLPFGSFSQKKLSTIIDVRGNKGAWIHDINILNKDLFLVDGLYANNFTLGQDTLPAVKATQNFIAQFDGTSAKTAAPSDGRVLKVDQYSFYVASRVGSRFKDQTLSKFDFNYQLIWRYSLSLRDSSAGTLLIQDVCFGDVGDTYVLFWITGSGEIQLNNETVSGPGDLIVRIDKNGHLHSFKMVPGRYSRLRYENKKLCAYGGVEPDYSACVLSRDLKEKIINDDLIERCKFKVWDKRNFFRVTQGGSRPQRLFYVEKNNVKGVSSRKEIFRDTLWFEDEIYQYEILDLNKREVLIAYVSRGNNWAEKVHFYTNINILIVNKKNLDISKRIVINCDRLDVGRTGVSSDIAFRIFKGDLLIGNDYNSYCRIGDIELGDKDEKGTRWSSFFIVKQSLK